MKRQVVTFWVLLLSLHWIWRRIKAPGHEKLYD
jgi:hypothetical protein